MRSKQVILTFISVAAIVVYFLTPYYGTWLMQRIFNPHLSIFYQAQHTDVNERKEIRFGDTYLICKSVIDTVENGHISNPVVLLPPTGYLRSINFTTFDNMDPAAFYYFTGLKAVTVSSPDVEQANLTLVPNKNHQLVTRRIPSRGHLEVLIGVYKKYADN